MTTRIPRLAGVFLAAGLLVGTAAPALADDDSTAETRTDDAAASHNLKERCQQAIERRLTDLAAAQVRVAGVDAVTDAHAATINSIIDTTEAGLSAHEADLDAEDDRLEIVRLCAEIATEFRVYLVVLPQTHLTVGADRVNAAGARGDALIAAFDDAVDAAIAAGADVAEAVELRDAAAAHLAAAIEQVDGAADAVLTVTPSSYNAGGGQTVISDTRSAVRAAHDELKDGIADGHAAIKALREALDAVGED